jgi:hypothetical protein
MVSGPLTPSEPFQCDGGGVSGGGVDPDGGSSVGGSGASAGVEQVIEARDATRAIAAQSDRGEADLRRGTGLAMRTFSSVGD